MPKIVDKEETRARVRAAALDCFAEMGYHGTTMEAIARRLGVAKGTIYLYYPTKEAVATAIVEAFFAELEASVVEAPPAESLGDFVAGARHILDIDEPQAKFVRLFFEIFGPSFSSEGFTRSVAAIFDRLGAHLAGEIARLQERGEIAREIDARTFGRALVSALDGLVLHRGIFALSPRRHRAMVESFLEVMARGLAPAEDFKLA